MDRKNAIERRKGNLTLRFDPDTHVYTLNDGTGEVVLPSVTGVLSILAKPKVSAWAMDLMAKHIVENYEPGMSVEDLEMLVADGKRAHLEESKKATDTGSEVHDWIEAFVSGQVKEFPEDAKARAAIERFIDWWHERDREPLLSEEIVAHPELLYAGKVDLMLADGTLVDFKTSKALYREHELQLGGYALALEAWSGVKAKRGLLVRLGKDGSFEAREVALEEAKEVFASLVRVYSFIKR